MCIIRQARMSDKDILYAMCLLTGDAGHDASHLYKDKEMLGSVFALPYLHYYTDLAFILEDSEGACGYIIGALDMTDFHDFLEKTWYPSLRKKYGDIGDCHPHSDAERVLLERINNPVLPNHKANHKANPKGSPKALHEFPSELHINILPRAQGKGQGAALMNTLFDALRADGSLGVHLGVNQNNTKAKLFYEKFGFIPINNNALPQDTVFMGLKF